AESPSEGLGLGASTPVEGVDGQVPRGERSRTRSDPGGSSLKRYRSRAAGKPDRSQPPTRTPGILLRRRVHGPLIAVAVAIEDPREVASELLEPTRWLRRRGAIPWVEDRELRDGGIGRGDEQVGDRAVRVRHGPGQDVRRPPA